MSHRALIVVLFALSSIACTHSTGARWDPSAICACLEDSAALECVSQSGVGFGCPDGVLRIGSAVGEETERCAVGARWTYMLCLEDQTSCDAGSLARCETEAYLYLGDCLPSGARLFLDCLDPEGDPDHDGIRTSVDRCPVDGEDYDGFEDEDGCPEGILYRPCDEGRPCEYGSCTEGLCDIACERNADCPPNLDVPVACVTRGVDGQLRCRQLCLWDDTCPGDRRCVETEDSAGHHVGACGAPTDVPVSLLGRDVDPFVPADASGRRVDRHLDPPEIQGGRSN